MERGIEQGLARGGAAVGMVVATEDEEEAGAQLFDGVNPKIDLGKT